MSEQWVDETLYPGWCQRFRVVREIAHARSAMQDIVIVETETHGRVLLLDGAVQITEADEFVYQEMIVHVPLLVHGDARRVLIIGAGDGGVLRRVLQHRQVESAVMVEIDGEVIRLAREFLPAIGGLAWDDTRATVIVGDGIDHGPGRRRRDPLHRCVLPPLCQGADAERPGGQPVRRPVHAASGAGGNVAATCPALRVRRRLCRGGPNLCRGLHDAGPRLTLSAAGSTG